MSDHAYALPSGFMLDEYRIEKVIGSGGFGITYYAWDTYLNKPVAIKEYMPNEFAVRLDETSVAPKATGDANDYQWGLDRFLDEAATLASFNHPNINKVYRRIQAHGTAYMVLEYIPGETLSARLKRDKKLSPNEVWQLFTEMMSGLEEVHRMEYVHRDIKPGNIMFREDGSAVLLDFGAARQAIGQRSKSVTSILTPGYAPIEQYDQNADDVGPWTDFYALGIVAYRCVTGIAERELIDAVARARLASRDETQKDMRSAVELAKGQYDERLLQAIDWCIKVDERERPKDVAALSDMLSGNVGDNGGKKTVVEPVGVIPGRTSGAARQDKKDLKIVGIIVAIILGIGLLGWGAASLVNGDDPAPEPDPIPVPRPDPVPDPVPGPLAENPVGHVQVNVNVDARVRINGESVGTARSGSPVSRRDLPVGYVEVVASARGYETETKRVRVREDQWTQVAMTLRPEPPPVEELVGDLRVTVNADNAVVRVDGDFVGTAPAQKRGLRSGTHTVLVTANGYESQTKQVYVIAGDTTEVHFDLKPDGPPPASASMIREAQTELHRIGYYSVGRPDGIAGARTREAIRQFQRSEGLSRTGEVTQELIDRLKRKRRGGNEFFVKDECSSPIELIINYKDLRGNWQTRAWWQFEPDEEAYLAHDNLRVSAKKGVWYFYARATDDSGYYWDDNEGNGKRVSHGGTTYEMRRMNSTGDKAELTLTCQ